jgi:hypothetical protein
MNECLLSKWIFKLESGDESACCTLLRRKYLGEKSFFSCNQRECSQFWKGLQAIKESCLRGIKYVLGDGKKTRFWLDIWFGEIPFRIRFPKLFRICHEQNYTVWEVLQSGGCDLSFRRSFGEQECREWEDLLQRREEVVLNTTPDTVTWVLERSGKFTTASLYKELTFTGFENRWLVDMLKARLPLKIKVFVWKVYDNRIPSAEQLIKRNWPGDIGCKVCGQRESTDHIMFQCFLAQFLWFVCRDAFNWPLIPTSVADIQECVIGEALKKLKNFLMLLFSSLTWSVWLIRNDFVFNNVVIPSPVVSLLCRKWVVLSAREERRRVEEGTRKLKQQLLSLHSEV